jgi:hypothetical protein
MRPAQETFTQDPDSPLMSPQHPSGEVIDLTLDDDEDELLPTPNTPYLSSRRNNVTFRTYEEWEGQGAQFEADGYQRRGHKSGDLEDSQIFTERMEDLVYSPRQSNCYMPRHHLGTKSDRQNYESTSKAEPSEAEVPIRNINASILKHQLEAQHCIHIPDPLASRPNLSSRPKNLDVEEWLETSEPPHADQYLSENQAETSGYNCDELQIVSTRSFRPDRDQSGSLSTTELDAANVPTDGSLARNSEDNGSYSTLKSSFSSQAFVLSEWPVRYKASLTAVLERGRENNRKTTKIVPRFTQLQPAVHIPADERNTQRTPTSNNRPGEESNGYVELATPVKRQKVSHTTDREEPFDPYKPPKGVSRKVTLQSPPPLESAVDITGTVMDLTGMLTDSEDEEAEYHYLEMRRDSGAQSVRENPDRTTQTAASHPPQSFLKIPPRIPEPTEDELLQVQREEEEPRAKVAREYEELLEKDPEIQKARRDERQARLRIEMDEAKAARLEEHKKRMAEMEQRQKAIDEKVAQLKVEEEKRKAAEAEKQRLEKLERAATTREAALQRTIQARKESEFFKQKLSLAAAATTSVRREQKEHPQGLENDVGAGAESATFTGFTARTKPKGPSQRRTEVEEAKLRAEALQPIGMRAIDLKKLAKAEKAKKAGEAQRKKEEAAKKARKEKELLLEAERAKKVSFLSRFCWHR